MSEIVATTIAVSRYAPQEARAIEVYTYAGNEGMTFGQLVMAVCCKRAAAIEAQSVNAMNRVTETSSWLEALSAATQQMLSASNLSETVNLGSSGYVCKKTSSQTPTLKDFLQYECGIDSSYLDISTYDKRMQLFDQVKTQIDTAARQSQEETIELQSLVSKRDVTFNTSAATVKAIGQSMINTAAQM